MKGWQQLESEAKFLRMGITPEDESPEQRELERLRDWQRRACEVMQLAQDSVIDADNLWPKEQFYQLRKEAEEK